YGQAFDIGNGTRRALMRFEEGTPALECGGKSDHENGNGSLMRILPIVFYLRSKYGRDFTSKDEAFQIIHNISALTHAHKRSQLACGIYISIASELFKEVDLKDLIQSGVIKAMDYYKEQEDFQNELHYYKRIESKDFNKIDIDEIKSSGYVVDSLEAAIWSLLNTTSYKDCVLKAVNLGEDTDTVAAIAGGLAGLYYGYGGIPEEWVEVIARKKYVEDLCVLLNESLERGE
ncbi:MAG TPA: ADP-ribosylglycohydrolase family protein, partial [Tissierellaceae bacterium]|nr:ADP-ribosylglycohydrolase family protein [Tissierellaceae bacterium]